LLALQYGQRLYSVIATDLRDRHQDDPSQEEIRNEQVQAKDLNAAKSSANHSAFFQSNSQSQEKVRIQSILLNHEFVGG
jgi:hypothetical protein